MKHKTEIDHSFELGDDPEQTRFLVWAMIIGFLISLFISAIEAYLLVRFADWLLQQ